MTGVIRSLRLPGVLLFAACACAPLFPARAADIPDNIDGNLKRLIVAKANLASGVKLNSVHLALNSATNRYELLPGKGHLIADEQNRVLVRVILDGSTALSAVEAAVAAAGGTVTASSSYAHGMLSAYIPVDNASSLATAAGVKALHLSMRPHAEVGEAQAQSVVGLQANVVQAQGITGRGVTVAAISDSFNTYGGPITAEQDVASGDLPRNSGRPDGLKALIQDSADGTDEGRAMLQIVHDMAPAAQLCFATGDGDQINFAANILKLATESGSCNADVIVDDLTYFSEPFFSDGVVADAVKTVATSPKSNGERVTYLSAAGNQQYNGYYSIFQPIDPKTAAKLPNNPVNLASIPKSIDIGGGLHNFGTSGDPVVAQQLIVDGTPILIFQWDDPFDLGKITTDYSLLLFDQNGNYIPASDTASNASSADNAFQTDEPIQGIAFDTTATGNSAVYYLVIARSSKGTKEAKRIKWIFPNEEGYIAAAFQTPSMPVLFGHHGSSHAVAVAAYEANRPGFSSHSPFNPELEDFSSPGPFINALDGEGNRLPTAEVRQKPDVACMDGLFTTFFGQYIRADDQYPRFYGTSAAAPCAAGVAALMIDKATHGKNPVILQPGEILTALRHSSVNHDLDPFVVTSVLPVHNGTLSVSVQGNNNNIGDPANFTVYAQKIDPGWTLSKLTLQNPPYEQLQYFQSSRFPFIVGAHTPGVGVTLLNLVPPSGQTLGESSTLEIGFTGFTSGDFVSFNVDRAEPTFGYIDDDADRLNGTRYTAEFTGAGGNKAIVNGVLNNQYGFGWNIFDGYGLINAERAVANVP